jgi:hypothetical protein
MHLQQSTERNHLTSIPSPKLEGPPDTGGISLPQKLPAYVSCEYVLILIDRKFSINLNAHFKNRMLLTLKPSVHFNSTNHVCIFIGTSITFPGHLWFLERVLSMPAMITGNMEIGNCD